MRNLTGSKILVPNPAPSQTGTGNEFDFDPDWAGNETKMADKTPVKALLKMFADAAIQTLQSIRLVCLELNLRAKTF